MKVINLIYQEYAIPDALQMHMLCVAGIADQVLSAWSGPPVDRRRLMRVLLLHDMGNIVKIHEELAANQQFRAKREVIISRYGTNDHAVSRGIGTEVGLTDDELALMDGKVFVRNDETVASDDFARKIGAYADQRAAPDGVRPILDRLREAQLRYRDKPGSSMNNPRTPMLIDCALKIEEQVMRHCAFKPDEITSDSVAPFVASLRNFTI